MKTLVTLAVATAVAAAVAPKATEAQDTTTTYQLVILKKGPRIADAQTPEGQKTLQAHVQHLYARGAEGAYKVAGPFGDDGEFAGIIVAAAATPEKALEMESVDPAVKAGMFTAEAVPFTALVGRFPGKWAAFGQFEPLFFVFLNDGASRGQDEATAKRLQQEHHAYIEQQAKDGRLVAAGPITAPGSRRGLVVYRVATIEEARERANGDPMVQAGRLAVDLHPWQVPIGAIK